MKFKRKYVISILLALMLLTAWVIPVYADMTSISPSTIVSGVATVITVSGSGLDSTARVFLDGVELPGPVFSSPTELKVTIPADVAVGTHIITVSVGGSPVTGSAVLNVSAPTGDVPFTRPQMIVTSTDVNVSRISIGRQFALTVKLKNAGSAAAYNAQAVFGSEDVVSTDTGGVIAVGNVPVDVTGTIEQTFIAYLSLYGKTVAVIDMTVTYYDEKGTSYSDKFTLSVPVSDASAGIAATATPTGVKSGQLIIPSYGTTVDPLQPGSQFTLTMTVQNVGNATANHVTMIVGGGGSDNSGGTPQPGGVSGGSGEFTNFAPVGTSNVQTLGDLVAGGLAQVSQNLIVNVSTNPGAYPMKISFSYVNDKGQTINDEQVITLLVYSLPFVEVNFYRVPDPFFVGQPGQLPIQLVNLGKRTAVLGNMTITTQNGTLENSTTLVGALDAGGYFTLDSMLTPDSSGKVTLNVAIDYTDDFNKARKIEKTLEVTVEEGFMEPTPDPSMQGGKGNGGGGGMEVGSATGETALQKIWRFILGLLGLDSAPPAVAPAIQSPEQQIPIPAPSGGGKGG